MIVWQNPYGSAMICAGEERKRLPSLITNSLPPEKIGPNRPKRKFNLPTIKFILGFCGLLYGRFRRRYSVLWIRKHDDLSTLVSNYCWWKKSELMGGLSHCLLGFWHPRWLAGFLKHQQYHLSGWIICELSYFAKFLKFLQMSVLNRVPGSQANISLVRLFQKSGI